jgi:flagellar hook-length control protein FliK
MNATRPVFQPQRSNDALQLNASASAGSQAAHANSQNFAGALNDADDKPARKNTTSRPHQADSSGSRLPPSGNQPPLAATPPPPPKTDAAPTNQASSTGSVAASGTTPNAGAKGQPVAADSTPPAGMAAPAGTAPPPATIATAQDGLPQDSAGSQAANGAGMPPEFSMTSTPDAAAVPTAPPVSTVLSGSAAGASAPAARVTAASSARAANPVDGTASKASMASATSAPISTDGNAAALGSTMPNGDSPPTDTGAAAQALMAAAIAQATSAPTTQSSPPADDLATPDTGTAPPGVFGSGAAPSPALAAASTQSSASITAAVRAATALSMAQAVSASANAGAADKHTRGSGPEFSLTGISNDGTGGAAQLMTSSTLTDVSPPATLKVSAGVDTAEFGQGVADRVSLMMDGNLTSARLQVNPPALGPIEVRIALQAGHAQVWFTSHSAVTRDALESSSPKLREMLGAQGFGQVSVDISQRSFQERSPQSHGYEGTPAISGESGASVQTASAPSRAASGLLDAYA